MEKMYLTKVPSVSFRWEKIPSLIRCMARYMSCTMVMFFYSNSVIAQVVQQETVLQDWQTLYVDQDNLGMSFRIVSCDDKVFLMLRLTSLKDQIAKQTFELQIINSTTNERFTKDISVDLPARQQIISLCEDSNYPDLKIALPPAFQASTVYVAATFN